MAERMLSLKRACCVQQVKKARRGAQPIRLFNRGSIHPLRKARHRHVAYAPPRAAGKILMVGLGLIKRPGRRNLRNHLVAKLPQAGHQLFCHSLLLRALIKDR